MFTRSTSTDRLHLLVDSANIPEPAKDTTATAATARDCDTLYRKYREEYKGERETLGADIILDGQA